MALFHTMFPRRQGHLSPTMGAAAGFGRSAESSGRCLYGLQQAAMKIQEGVVAESHWHMHYFPIDILQPHAISLTLV